MFMIISMQYKFYVDGEWRHDEHQPFVNGNSGVVNCVVIDREADMLPTSVSPEPSGNMEVDDVLMHPVRVPLTLSQ